MEGGEREGDHSSWRKSMTSGRYKATQELCFLLLKGVAGHSELRGINQERHLKYVSSIANLSFCGELKAE